MPVQREQLVRRAPKVQTVLLVLLGQLVLLEQPVLPGQLALVRA